MASSRKPPQNDSTSSDSSDSSSEEEEEEEGEIDQEEEEERDQDEETLPHPVIEQSQIKRLNPKQPAIDSDSEESGSGSEPEHSLEKPRQPKNQLPAVVRSSAVSPFVKPVSSKPMTCFPQLQKAQKSKVEHSVDLEEIEHGCDDQKKLFQRVWTDEDEIGLLNGYLNFTKKGGDPYSDKAGLVELVQKNLHIKFNRIQIFDKIRRLKKKYQKIASKGTEPNFKNPHEQLGYKISKNIWGAKVREDGEGWKGSKPSNDSKKRQRSTHSHSEDEKSDDKLSENMATGINGQKFIVYPYANGSSNLGLDTILGINSSGFILGRSPVVIFDTAMKEGLNLVDKSKLKQLEERWKNLQLMEMELLTKRAGLIKEQTQLILEALKSQNS